jgi:transcription antitermination factor NusG
MVEASDKRTDRPLSKYWYALHTTPRAEKKVARRLQELGFEIYLPLQKQLRQWSDRKKWVEMVLIPSYLFVYAEERKLAQLVQQNGVVRVLSFERKAVAIPEEQINWLKRLVMSEVAIELLQETIPPGSRVEVAAGSLAGLKGELVAHKSQKKVIVRLEHLEYSLLITIPSEWLRAI